MDIDIFELLLTTLIGLLAAVVSVIWAKAERAEKIAQNNRAAVRHLSKTLDKTGELTERLSSLEASFSVEIKNLSVSIKRMESALIRIDQNGRHRSH